MVKPYIKKYKTIYNLYVFFVDGEYIRTNIDKEFTNYGQNYRFPFIPARELWIDKEKASGETDFFVESMLIMRRELKKGKTHEQAVKIADKAEKAERAMSKLSLELKRLPKDERLEKIKKEKLMTTGRVDVWLVRGEAVRTLFFLDFTEGGHDKVYPFVPDNEVWIDDDLGEGERKFVLIHELYERWLMNGGKQYEEAHYPSSSLEYFCRKFEFMSIPVLLFLRFINGFFVK
jgi:hypothetical protein